MEDANKDLFSEEKREQFAKERKLLYKQFDLLAERSKNCTPAELAALSEQMINLHDFLF